jgi:hypothetical protein
MMMTPLDAQPTDVCQCTKAKGSRENEGELDTAMICPDCRLEEANTRDLNDVGQLAVEKAELPDEKTVYSAFKDSPGIKKIAGLHPSDQVVKMVILRRKKKFQSVKKLVAEYGSTLLIASLRVLMDEEVFTSYDAAKRRFPDLFPDEQLPGSEEGQWTMTELPVTTEGQPGNSECNPRDMTENLDSKHIIPDKGGRAIC